MRNRKSKNQLYKLSGALTNALIDDLKLKMHLSADKSVISNISYYDSFDWRLFKSGNFLIKDGINYSLYDFKKDHITSTRQIKTRKLPVFYNDFPESSLKNEISKKLGIRALIKAATIKSELKNYRILNESEKTVAWLKLKTFKKAGDFPEHNYLTIESVRGYNSEFSTINTILKNTGLLESSESPYLEALISSGVQPGSYSSKFRLKIDPAVSSAEALREILEHLLNTMKINEEGICKDIDTEFLHDYRVAVRRARSAISQVKYVLPEETAAKLKKDLSGIGKMTNRLRDLDVYLLKKDEYKMMLPENLRPGIEPVFKKLEDERAREQKKLASQLISKNYRRVLNDTRECLQNIYTDGNRGKNSDIKILLLAKKIIWKKYRTVVNSGLLIDEDTPDEKLHELRIECKKLRYLLEFFTSLFPENKMDIIIAQLKKLQDNLGDFNDYYVQQSSLVEMRENYSPKDPDFANVAMSIGGLIAILGVRQLEVRKEFKKKFTEFVNKRNRALYGKLFNN